MDNRRRFGNVDPNRRGRNIDINLPSDAGQSTPPRRPYRRGLMVGISLLLIICLVAGFFGYRLYANSQAAVTPTAFVPGQPVQPGGQPAVNTAVPGAPRVTLNVCIVNFGPYLPVLLIPNDNPVYELNLIPLNFYTDNYEEVVLPNIDTYPFINRAEESDQIAMLTDGRCDLLATTTDVHAKHPRMGQLFTIIGQSDGADKTVGWNFGVTQECLGRELAIFNNIYDPNTNTGCRLAAASDSVGLYQALSFLKLANIKASQVHIDLYPTPEQAAAACVNRLDDFCSGWVPAIDNMLDPALVGENTTKTFISSSSLKTIYDGWFVSLNADQNKSPAVLAFEEDWYVAVKMTQDNLPAAASKIAQWIYTDTQGNTWETNEYTYVWQGSEVDDLTYWFETYAQASFSDQFPMLQNPNLMYDIYRNQRDIWAWSEQPLDDGFDPASMLDLSYIQALASRTDLNSQNSFVNDSFSFFPEEVDPATRENLIKLPTLVEIVCPNVSFKPGMKTIDPNSPEFESLVACGQQIKLLLNQSNLQILVIGSGAWPGEGYDPKYGTCGTHVLNDPDPRKNDPCWDVAVGRASFAQSVFIGDPLFIPPQRIALDYQLGPKTPKYDPITGQLNDLSLQDSRFVTIQVKVGAGGIQ